MNIKMLDKRTLDAIASYHGIENEPIEVIQEKLKHESEEELFEAFLTWHGIIGYSRTILSALERIKLACYPDPK